MPELLKQESPLAHVTGTVHSPQTDIDLWLDEYPASGFINLRRDPSDGDFVKLVSQNTNIRLPEVPNSSVSSLGISALWVGPHEWLIVTPGGLEAPLADSLHKTLANRSYSVTDVSSGNTGMTLRGNRIKDVLAKGCAIDLHDRYFTPGMCVQTQVAKANVILWRQDTASRFEQQDNVSRFDLIVRRSFAEYLALWLLDAGQEYNLKFSTKALVP